MISCIENVLRLNEIILAVDRGFSLKKIKDIKIGNWHEYEWKI